MRSIIAIEVSTPTGSVAAVTNDSLLFEQSFTSGRSHNSSLFAPLKEALEALPQPDAILIGTGPGSYTGVRVGIAAAAGISIARGVPVAGAPSALALPSREGSAENIIAVGDARRGNGWWMTIDPSTGKAEPPQVLPVAEIPDALATLVTATLACGESGAPEKLGLAELPAEQPQAIHLARWAIGLNPDAFQALLALPALPIYVQPPFISTPKKPGK